MYAHNLSDLRKYHHLTHQDVAEYIGDVTAATVRNWEEGIAEPKLVHFLKLAKLYHVNYNDLYYGDFSTPQDLSYAKPGLVPKLEFAESNSMDETINTTYAAQTQVDLNQTRLLLIQEILQLDTADLDRLWHFLQEIKNLKQPD